MNNVSIFLYVLLLLFLFYLIDIDAYVALHKTKPKTSYLQMTASIEEEKLTFGEELILDIKLPTRSRELAESFLLDGVNGENYERLLQATWKNDFKKLTTTTNTTTTTATTTNIINYNNCNVYELTLDILSLPGFGTIETKIEVEFFTSDDGRVGLKSRNYSLSGSSSIVKDTFFMDSFIFKIHGYISCSPCSSSSISYDGKIIYEVGGIIPQGISKGTLLDTMVNLIQEAVKYFAVTKFKKSLLKEFRQYLMKNKK